MAFSIMDFLGGGGDKVLLRGTDHENVVFGLKNSEFLNGYPKLKFEHFVRFNLSASNPNTSSDKLPSIAALVKTADYPSMSIDTTTLNQYNKKRVIQKKIEFDKVTIVIHDVADGLTLDFWKKYYNYTFKDGASTTTHFMGGGFTTTGTSTRDKMFSNNQGNKLINASDTTSSTIIGLADPKFYNNYGLTARTHPFFESIELFYSRGKIYDKVVLVRPKISDFKHDTINYEDGTGMMSLSFTFEYENVIYGDVLPFDDDNAASDVPSRLGHTTQLSRSTGKPISRVGGGTEPQRGSSADDPFGLGGKLGGIFSNIGSDLSKSIVSKLTTGNWNMSNPLTAIKQIAKQTGANIVGSAKQNLTRSLTTTVNTILTPSADQAAVDEQANDKDQGPP